MIRQTRFLRNVVLASAGGAALVVLLGLSALAWYQRTEALSNGRERAELLADVLQDQASRTVESAAVALRALGDSLQARSQADPAHEQALLSQSLLGLSSVRSLALVDESGLVLASSEPRDNGVRLPLAQLESLPAAGRSKLLGLQAGRGLADMRSSGGSHRVSFLPLWHRTASGKLLVALINPDALATYQQTVADQSAMQALLVSYQGQVLTATEQLHVEVGSSLANHPVLARLIGRQEHGSYLGEGVVVGPQVVAWRGSRTQPFLMLIEQPQDLALQSWYQGVWKLAGLGLLMLSLLVAASIVALRSLRGRVLAVQSAQEAHEKVALREREMSVVLKSVQELIFRAGLGGVLTFVNARWGAVTQDRAELAVGRRLQDLVEPADAEKAAALFDPDERPGPRTAQIGLRSAEGGLRQYEVAVVPLYAKQQLVGFAGSAVDVTEREVAQQQLQRQLAFTGLLLEVSPQPISLVDMQGRYVTVNRAWEEFTGLKREQVIGGRVGSMLSMADRQVHERHDAQLLAEGGTLRYEARMKHAGGQPRDMQVTKVLLLDEQGGAAGILNTLMDVSEFREAERATREARDAAEDASRAKSEFIANISHELRTPLQSILGFSELGVARGRESPKLVTMFESIHASGQRMLALVNDLLDVSKIESAVGTFHMERCDLRAHIRSVAREFDPLLQPRRLQLDCAISEQPLSAKVDPLRFQQVVRNVLANAVKFSPDGSNIELKAARHEDGLIHIDIADRGPGIPPGELEAIFDAFVQSSKTKDGSGGTGLGLAICRKIVELHKGSIQASNREGGGALFSIVLPSRGDADTGFTTTY
ncbi:PAS domain S-box protein [Pelomonas sp. V22]|uniref:ATP-binding protein n=1 Tax=Pelomonas sp. V22 TaxID=2822139 RepID=UPI0024A8D12E|nr:ATP-binding protein [Pelomonas sp. V22]MDI4634359.1 PAS domain S-box protein [Pelomonas sp. V22]